MGCSATKTVPQERPSPDKGQSNGEILKTHKDTDVTSNIDKDKPKQNSDSYSSQNGGQTGGHTGGQNNEHTGDQLEEKVKSRISTDLSLSKDLGLRKLQRKETPQAGPLAQNNKAISQSQMEFFKLLDEKIERGGEYEEGDDVT